MARVDYTGTTDVAPQVEAPQDYEHEEASPADFGAAATQSVQAIGAGVQDVTKFYGQVAADNGTNNTLQQVTAILHGDPNKMVPGPDGQLVPDTGFFGKRGADAMASREETAKQIDEAIQENRENLSTPEAKLQYDNDTRRYRAQWQTQMGTYADAQQNVWARDTNNTSAVIALNAASRSPTDPDAVAQAQENVRKSYVRNAQLNGEDPQGAVLKADQDVTMARIRSLVVKDPLGAEKVLNDSAGVLGSRPDYDQISRGVKSAVIDATMSPAIDKAVSDAVSAAHMVVGAPVGAPGPTDISAAIGVQEWHGKGPAPTSIDGAVGNSQIKPDTAVQYGLDPAKLNDPTYAKFARDVIVSKISALPNVQGDPARVAVGYFSGAGNIAPLDSPTPYIHNAADGNGKTTASYVQDVVGRTQKFPSTADALNASMSQTLDTARTTAEQLFPNYPDAQERYVTGVERRLNQTVSQQHQQYEVDSHVVQSVLAGPKPPVSEEELKAAGPQVAAAWSSMQVNNPYGAMSVERMFDANSKGKAQTYGTGFKEYLDRALAPTTDATRIANSSQLWPYVGSGEDSPLTNTGVNALSDLLALRQGPQGEAAAAQIKDFMDQAHQNLTYSNPSLGRVDPKGEALFSRFAAQAMPILQNAVKNGNLSGVLNPKNPDYLGNVAQTFARTPAEIMKDRLYNQTPVGKAVLEAGDTAAQGRFLLKDAVDKGQLTREQATQIGEAHGFFAKRDAAKPVPLQAPPVTPQTLPAPGGG